MSDLRAVPRSWEYIEDFLARCKAAPHGWGDDNDIPLSEHVYAPSLAFIRRCSTAGLPHPFPHYAGDGEFDVRWGGSGDGESFASLGFLEDGSAVAYVRTTGRTLLAQDQPAEDYDVGPFLALVKELFGEGANDERHD